MSNCVDLEVLRDRNFHFLKEGLKEQHSGTVIGKGEENLLLEKCFDFLWRTIPRPIWAAYESYPIFRFEKLAFFKFLEGFLHFAEEWVDWWTLLLLALWENILHVITVDDGRLELFSNFESTIYHAIDLLLVSELAIDIRGGNINDEGITFVSESTYSQWFTWASRSQEKEIVLFVKFFFCCLGSKRDSNALSDNLA